MTRLRWPSSDWQLVFSRPIPSKIFVEIHSIYFANNSYNTHRHRGPTQKPRRKDDLLWSGDQPPATATVSMVTGSSAIVQTPAFHCRVPRSAVHRTPPPDFRRAPRPLPGTFSRDTCRRGSRRWPDLAAEFPASVKWKVRGPCRILRVTVRNCPASLASSPSDLRRPVAQLH